MKKADDFSKYREELSRMNDEFNPLIQRASSQAYEYGILAVKNLLLVSGGALLAIPAVSSLSQAFDVTNAAIAGAFFGGAVSLSLLVIYLTHLNYQFHTQVWIWRREQNHAKIHEFYLPNKIWGGECIENIQHNIDKYNRYIHLTYLPTHFVGLLAFVSFAYACLRLYKSVGLSI